MRAFSSRILAGMRVKLKTLTKDFDFWSLDPQTPGINHFSRHMGIQDKEVSKWHC
jgi:hypothetical protein